MAQIRKSEIKNVKSVTTFGLTEEQHNIVCERLTNDDYGNIVKDNHFLTVPDDALVREWIDQCIRKGTVAREAFLKDAVKNNAKIYTLYTVIPEIGAKPVGDVAVTIIK